MDIQSVAFRQLYKLHFTRHEEMMTAMSIHSTEDTFQKQVAEVVSLLYKTWKAGGVVYLFGNGGCAADAQHWASELMGYYDTHDPASVTEQARFGIPALALNTDTSYMTAWANDKDFSTVFSRQVRTLASTNDLFIGLSTSGASANVLLALKAALEEEAEAILLTGSNVDTSHFHFKVLQVPASTTATIQEGFVFAYHLICDLLLHCKK